MGRYKRINPDLNRPFFNLYLFRQQAGNRDIGFYRHTMKNILISRNHLYSVTPPGLNQISSVEVARLTGCTRSVATFYSRSAPSLSQIAHGAVVNQVGFAPGPTLGVLFSVFAIAHGFSLHVLSPVGI